MLDVKKLLAKALAQTSDRFRGIDPSRVINYGTTSITPSRDGVWVIGGPSSTGNPLPVIYVRCSGQIINTVIGTNYAGDYAFACVPVKKGVSYSAEAYRINVNASLVYY